MAAIEVPSQLLQLSDPCLLEVLQCCASDPRSLLSAARAHSRLHQAAVLALSSMSARGIRRQQDVESVLLYLSKHGNHVNSLDLVGGSMRLSQLPDQLKLSSLVLARFCLQLQPGGGFQGVVRPGLPLKRLRLHDCRLLDGKKGLAAALALLPGLQHLSIDVMFPGDDYKYSFPTDALSAMQQLTHLELVDSPAKAPPALQFLAVLTRLVDLRLHLNLPGSESFTAAVDSSMLSAAHHLTHLVLSGAVIRHDALAGLTQLQHLSLARVRSACLVQLLSQLQHLQQLSHLQFFWDAAFGANLPPAAAFSALTASSKLQHLKISSSTLSAGVWQHVFPAGRQLPHLQSLDLSSVWQWEGEPALEGTRLVGCCPALRSLDIGLMQYSAEQLAPLAGLSGLHTLRLANGTRVKGVEAVCQLTGLRELTLHARSSEEGLPLGLTRLEKLTLLEFRRPLAYGTDVCRLSQAPGDEPLCRQVLWHPLLDYR